MRPRSKSNGPNNLNPAEIVMNMRTVALSLSLLPFMLHANSTCHTNGVSITATVCKHNDCIFTVNGWSYTTHAFVHRKLKPVWIEVSNTRDTDIHITNRSHVCMQTHQAAFANYYKPWPYVRSLGFILMCGTAMSSMILSGVLQAYRNSLVLDNDILIGTPWEDLSSTEKLTFILNSKAHIYTFISSTIVASVLGFVGWRYFSHFNEQFDTVLNDLLLHDQLVVTPGGVVKKLVLLATENSCILDIVHPRTHIVLESVEITV